MSDPRPTSGPLAELSLEEFSDFIWNLGWITFRSIHGAAFARHQHPRYTIKDYLDIMPNDPRPEALAKEYLKDLSGNMKTEELARKWFLKDSKALMAEAQEGFSEIREERKRRRRP